jgi:hypothetical protein
MKEDYCNIDIKLFSGEIYKECLEKQQEMYLAAKKKYGNLRTAPDPPITLLEKAKLINYLNDVTTKDLLKYMNPSDKMAQDMNGIKAEATKSLLDLLLSIRDTLPNGGVIQNIASPIGNPTGALQHLDKIEKLQGDFIQLLNEKLKALGLKPDLTPINPNTYNYNDPNSLINPNNPNNILPTNPNNIPSSGAASQNGASSTGAASSLPGSGVLNPAQLQELQNQLTNTINKQLGNNGLSVQAQAELSKLVASYPDMFKNLLKNGTLPLDLLKKLAEGSITPQELLNKLKDINGSSFDFVVDNRTNNPCDTKVPFNLYTANQYK